MLAIFNFKHEGFEQTSGGFTLEPSLANRFEPTEGQVAYSYVDDTNMRLYVNPDDSKVVDLTEVLNRIHIVLNSITDYREIADYFSKVFGCEVLTDGRQFTMQGRSVAVNELVEKIKDRTYDCDNDTMLEIFVMNSDITVYCIEKDVRYLIL